MGDLNGLAAIVTGAGQGIGAGIAIVLASRGARIAATDINGNAAEETAHRITAAGGKAISLQHDITSSTSSARAVAETRRQLGLIDVLVNNAGISQRIRFADIDEAAWDRMIDVNLKGVYLMIREVLPEMVQRHTGRIINISSIAGKVGPALLSHYAASKFGVIGLTQSLARECAPHGIRINAVAPGKVRTPIWNLVLRDVAAQNHISVDQAWKEALRTIPLGRPQTPEDIGHAVAFLASDRARNITGETINVNGGYLMD